MDDLVAPVSSIPPVMRLAPIASLRDTDPMLYQIYAVTLISLFSQDDQRRKRRAVAWKKKGEKSKTEKVWEAAHL